MMSFGDNDNKVLFYKSIRYMTLRESHPQQFNKQNYESQSTKLNIIY